MENLISFSKQHEPKGQDVHSDKISCINSLHKNLNSSDSSVDENQSISNSESHESIEGRTTVTSISINGNGSDDDHKSTISFSSSSSRLSSLASSSSSILISPSHESISFFNNSNYDSNDHIDDRKRKVN